jgi:hypothetical protein
VASIFGGGEYIKKRSVTWVMGGVMVLAFVAGIIVDIDHPIAWLLGFHNGRFLMGFFAAASYWALGCGAVLAITCICRYAWVRFLRKSP